MVDHAELLNCPFCGEKPKLNEHRDARGLWQSVGCENPKCGLGETCGQLNGASIKQWNTRLCAALEARANEGWVLVPRELTDAMKCAAAKVVYYYGTPQEWWDASLAAAPASPSARDVVPTDDASTQAKRANDLKEQEIAALRAIANRPIPLTAFNRLETWWTGRPARRF